MGKGKGNGKGPPSTGGSILLEKKVLDAVRCSMLTLKIRIGGPKRQKERKRWLPASCRN